MTSLMTSLIRYYKVLMASNYRGVVHLDGSFMYPCMFHTYV